MASFDLVIVGGGLAGGLCALALRHRRPDIRLLLIEPGATIGGNHLWSFFESDVAPAHRWLTDSLLPRVRKETPASDEPAKTLLCGVSLGGYCSLEVMVRGVFDKRRFLDLVRYCTVFERFPVSSHFSTSRPKVTVLSRRQLA